MFYGNVGMHVNSLPEVVKVNIGFKITIDEKVTNNQRLDHLRM